MGRILSFTVRGLCLVVATGAMGLWVRSHYVADQYSRIVWQSGLMRAIGTRPGELYARQYQAFI